jgi:hypothetical protein
MSLNQYTEPQIYESFCLAFQDEHGTLDGVKDSYEWWKNPLKKCLIEDAGRGGKRCKAQCQTCEGRLIV